MNADKTKSQWDAEEAEKSDKGGLKPQKTKILVFNPLLSAVSDFSASN